MAARAADRRHVRSVETGLEIRLALEASRDADASEDAALAKVGQFARGMLVSLNEAKSFDRLSDDRRDRAIALATELVGILDGVEPTPVLEEALDLREAQAVRA